jgi:hypothetical protein
MIEFGCLLTFESKHIIEEDYNEIYGGNKWIINNKRQ